MPYKDLEKRKAYAKKYYSTYRSRDVEKWRAYEAKWKRDRRAKDPELERAYAREYRAKNGDLIRAQDARSYLRQVSDPKRRERRLELGRNWRKRNPEKVQAGWDRWTGRNKDRLRELWRIWSAKRRHVPVECSESQWLSRVAYYGNYCAYCRQDLKNVKYELDHVIPVKRGGLNWASNFVPACSSCNRKKNIRRWVPCPVIVKELCAA